ncbi:hypothetical protein [Dyadobacter sp. CY356]|uniref:hypothetical protein n=1 Tax=Dyadobacter sp. CY356 TaxID=2906442 RepID=UPI001F24D387|nr:hypothetical protein [Dyadobacter sp. CY356]MCF0054827.1 hypothetical protein [Dyadobacter sp. CY356]
MNLFILTIGTLLSNSASCPPTDTIILRAGNDSKVIFYGKSKNDLKKLELLDLNKILRELNKTQDHSDSLIRQQVTLNNNEFVKEHQKPTKMERYIENTFLNLQIGTGYHANRYTFFQPAPSRLGHPAASLTSDIVMENLMTSNLSVFHDMKFVDRPKFAFALRYGVGLGLNIQRYLHWNLLQSVPVDDVAVIATRARELLKTEEITPLQSDFNAFQSYFQVSPKIAVKNKKGISTFYMDFGVRLNYNRNFENVNPSAYAAGLMINSPYGATATTDGPVITGGGYGAYSKKQTVGISYLAEIGYKWIGIFVVYYPDNIQLTTNLLSETDRPDSGFVKDKKGNLGYVSFGIKIGR